MDKELDRQNAYAFMQMIRNIIKEELSNTSNQSEKFYNGIVRSVSVSSTEDVAIDPYQQVVEVEIDDNTRLSMYNKSGEELKVNDAVRIYGATNNNSDLYIGTLLKRF